MAEAASRPGLLRGLRGSASAALALLQTRLALLGVELQEESRRVLGVFLWGLVAILASLIGLAFLAVFLTVLLWDSHRLLVLGIGTTVFLLFGITACLIVLRLARSPSELFAASLAELSKDRASLRGQDAASQGRNDAP